MFTSNLLRIFGMQAMLVRYIIHFILLLCPDCLIYITKYRANYEFYNCLHNEKFTLSEYLQIQSQHSFFMSIHSGKAALLKYFWKANTKWILNTDKRRAGKQTGIQWKALAGLIQDCCVLFCPVLHLIVGMKMESGHQWKWKRARKMSVWAQHWLNDSGFQVMHRMTETETVLSYLFCPFEMSLVHNNLAFLFICPTY